MAVFEYKKYKVKIQSDSSKTQGLQTGDIVRRQYFDGRNLIYSLMCVLDYGIDEVTNVTTGKTENVSYFIGALLEGDVPTTGEILDFARITNLYNLDRSGALYLTGSDDAAPYIDVIDNIGRNCSLCWPENIATTDYIDPSSQYVTVGDTAVNVSYNATSAECNRICNITASSSYTTGHIGVRQDFYQYIANPNRVLISYKAKASKAVSVTASLGYSDDLRIDGSLTTDIGTEWTYQFNAITVEWSGRHLRSVQISTDELGVGDQLCIADLNIILLSSISSFNDASQTRIGKLDGVSDPVFGQLEGYGVHLKKIYATQSAHISGTITAGDENGFASTFYAGKIHRNVFVNSIDINWANGVAITTGVGNPTGVGHVYSIDTTNTMFAQSPEWLASHIGTRHSFSFWLYSKNGGQLAVLQNTQSVGVIQITPGQVGKWQRYKVSFEILSPVDDGDGLELTLMPTFVTEDLGGAMENTMFFSSPQLEQGQYISQYQPTDAILNYGDEYGAWFNRGGIGGTIQNPLLQLNYDGAGSIGTRSKSFLLGEDGSGYLANQNIRWDKTGKVNFGSDVTLNWDNLSDNAQTEIVSKSVAILGADTFTVTGNITDSLSTCSPSEIILSLQEHNISSTSSQRQWSYLQNGSYVAIDGANGSTLTVAPNAEYWQGESAISIQCTVTINQKTYSDTKTIQKQYRSGYAITVESQQGKSFKNGQVQTTLTAVVSYNGIVLSTSDVDNRFSLLWKKYTLPDISTEINGWWSQSVDSEGVEIQAEIDRTKRAIILNYALSAQDKFVCELHSKDD